jgi:hypothetical protein
MFAVVDKALEAGREAPARGPARRGAPARAYFDSGECGRQGRARESEGGARDQRGTLNELADALSPRRFSCLASPVAGLHRGDLAAATITRDGAPETPADDLLGEERHLRRLAPSRRQAPAIRIGADEALRSSMTMHQAIMLSAIGSTFSQWSGRMRGERSTNFARARRAGSRSAGSV